MTRPLIASRIRRGASTAALVGCLVVSVAACAGQPETGQPSQAPPTSPAPVASTVAPTPTASTVEVGAEEEEAGEMQITLTVGETRLVGTLEDSEAARDFAELMPVMVRLTDFNGTEKISDLPRRLAVEDAPPGTDAQAGDIAYYAPWGNLALFYGDAPYAEGLVRLGRFERGALAELGRIKADSSGVIRLAPR